MLLPLPTLLAQAATTINPATNWLGQITAVLTTLTTENGDALAEIGTALLGFIGTVKILQFAIRYQAGNMRIGGGVRPLEVGELVLLLFKISTCSLVLHYWSTPIPGADFGLNKLFSSFAQVIVAALDQRSLDDLLQLISSAATNTVMPIGLRVDQMLLYLVVEILLGLVDAVLFFINSTSFIFYGVAALFGPLFVPLYLSDTLRGKLTHYLDVLLSFAMMRAVAAAFIFVWDGFMKGFIHATFQGDFSLGIWVGSLVPCMMVFGAFILNMTQVPAITQAIFGGSAGMANRMGEVVEQTASAVNKVAQKAVAGL